MNGIRTLHRRELFDMCWRFSAGDRASGANGPATQLKKRINRRTVI